MPMTEIESPARPAPSPPLLGPRDNGGSGRGRVSPGERLAMLCDPGSVHSLRSKVKSARAGTKTADGDGVLGASGTISGRPVFCYAQDGAMAGGSLGEAHSETIVRVLRLAGEARVPVVGFIESAGARMQEGSSALVGYARIFRSNVELSGRVPQISIVTATSAGGGCYSPALTDFVIMTRGASMFLTGPKIVSEVTGESVAAEELGGPKVQSANGVCHFVAAGPAEAAKLARDLLSYLPQSAWDRAPHLESKPPPGEDPGAAMPIEPGRPYDVRDVVAALVDRKTFLEVAPKWARNMVTGFARLDGRSVGIVANQPRYLGGVIDAASAQKAARFVRTCNAFGLPLLVLVDTPGFMPGTRQEAAGVIRHGAKLLHAFAEATVPKVNVVLRQAYGGGYIAMNSRELGADFSFAWPGARIGIMGAQQAVGIIHRRQIAAAKDPDQRRSHLAIRYADEHQCAEAAAMHGTVDEVVSPADTRSRLAAAFAALQGKSGARGCTGNIPL